MIIEYSRLLVQSIVALESTVAEVLLFHHLKGLTPGLESFAGRLRDAGHTVNAPDLFGGRVFESLEDGFAYVRGADLDFDALADEAASGLPAELVYVGFSYGVMPAQRLAQTRAGARGAVLIEAAAPLTGEWGFGPWPHSVPVQIHGKDADEFFVGEGDIEYAREIVAAADDGELFLYDGGEHLFADASLPTFDRDAAALLEERVLEFLARIDERG
jgi:dienelactone hydrolase